MAPFGTSILQHLLYESSTANRIARFGTFSNVTARLTNNHIGHKHTPNTNKYLPAPNTIMPPARYIPGRTVNY